MEIRSARMGFWGIFFEFIEVSKQKNNRLKTIMLQCED